MADYQEEETPALFSANMFPNGPNAEFTNPNVTAEELIEKFAGKEGGRGLFEDAEQRDIARNATLIVGILAEKFIEPTHTIADVGAGTGLLLKHLSETVPSGSVIAAELAPHFRAWIGARIENEGLGNVRVVESSPHNPFHGGVEPASVDLALLCDVYHHIEYPKTTCRNIRKALRPGTGRLVVIDFHRDPERVTFRPPQWVYDHLRGDQDTFRNEILSTGFELVEEIELEELKENYFMVFAPVETENLASPGVGWS